MKLRHKLLSVLTSCAVMVSAASGISSFVYSEGSADISDSMEWGTVEIGGGGFVSGIVTGQNVMYARTDVGGAYKYNYDTEEWVQLFGDLTEADRGMLSIDAMVIDPTDDDTVYFLCGCAYFSDARTEIFKTTDGGKTFTRTDVTDLIQVHGNGYGRQCGEAIAVDPDNPDIVYCGGDATVGDSGLIMSEDGGKTWKAVKGYGELDLFTYEINWPSWTTHKVKTTDTEYGSANGVGTLFIDGGKVYVGTSVNGVVNMHVADVGSDDFTELSADLPTDVYPARITQDADGRLLITYVAGLAFARGNGGIYRYDPKTQKVEDISPSHESFGQCVSLPDDANTLVATTCGVWSSQLWYEGAWADEKVCWGDQFYRSTDGGQTWESITPGNEKSWGGPLQADYLQDGGFDWIQNKAIHWSGGLVIDPTRPDKIFICSGNGVFTCDNVWDELPVFYFHPNGIEEVVAMDMISIPGGSNYSAIGDYDGFEHTDVNVSGKQYSPTMGSTNAIAYCPQNPDVMIRIAEHNNDVAPGFYTTDGGETWLKMANSPGGKAAITQLDDDTYRFFKSNSDDGNVSYSDDFGQTWTACSGISSIYGSKTTYMFVEPDKPNVVYAYATYYNSSWFYSKDEPDMSDAHYTFYVSTDYGKTFTGTDIAMYDQCDSAGRIAYLEEDNLILGAGWYGMYNVTNGGKDVEKLDVYYCKTVGYGAPENEGDVNTLYMYGQPQESDTEGIYRSQDGGQTWVLINSHNLYGGTGNGNFLVGDMNEFGTVYMSTVGCGIVYGKLSDSNVEPTEPTETTEATNDTEDTTESDSVTNPLYGDVNVDGQINGSDIVVLNKYLLNAKSYPLKNSTAHENADVVYDGEILTSDSSLLVAYVLGIEGVVLGPTE